MCEKLFGKRLYAGGITTATCSRTSSSSCSGVLRAVGIEVVVQVHVEQRELDLAHRLQAALEILRREHLVEQLARQRRARVDVRAHAAQHIPLPAEVLHELAGQLDRVPFDAVDAGHAAVLDARQQVVQAVAEFVEQRDDFVVREQRRPARRPAREKLQLRYATGVCMPAASCACA